MNFRRLFGLGKEEKPAPRNKISPGVSVSGIRAEGSIIISGGRIVVDGKEFVQTEPSAQTKIKREAGYFDKLVLNLPIDVEWSPGGCEIELEGATNVLSQIDTIVKNGVLTIKSKGNSFMGQGTIRARLSSSTLTSVENEGVGRIEISGLNADQCNISNKGSGKVNLDGWIGKCQMNNQGAGKIDCVGYIERMRLTQIGAGVTRLVATKDIEIVSGGSGSVRVGVVRSIEGQVMGAGEVTIEGQDIKVNVHKMGAARVRTLSQLVEEVKRPVDTGLSV